MSEEQSKTARKGLLGNSPVAFERYDEGPIITDEKGIATFEGGAKVAYFRDPEGNTLSIAQAPRS